MTEVKYLFALKLSFLAIPLFAAQEYAARPSAHDIAIILRDARAAVGAESELARIRSISVIADCIGPKGKYTTAIDSFRDQRTRFSQSFSYKTPPVSVFINGDEVWTQNSSGGEFEISSSFQRMVARAHEYQKMAFDIRSFFSDLVIVGDGVFEGRPSVKVRSKNELGMTTILYFDKETRRFSGYVLEIPNSTETIKNVFLEWRKVGHLTLPVVVRATDKQGDWTLRFSKITFNKASEKLVDIPPRIADMAELLRLHEQHKVAHLTYNAELFVETFAEQLTQLQRGDVATKTKAENLARFKSYFSSFKFIEWEDIAPPVINISKDGTMATKIVQKRVRGTHKNEKGEEVSEHTVFAWLEVLQKLNGKWKVVTVASTEKAGDK